MGKEKTEGRIDGRKHTSQVDHVKGKMDGNYTSIDVLTISL